MSTLFSPLQVGALTLPNRIVMAPLTRARAGATHVPNDMMVEYYAQRASSGLVMTECSMVDAHGCAFMGEAGIYDSAQVAGWRRVTDAVHARGGRICIQIWHPGRAAHSLMNGGEQPVSSSAVAIGAGLSTPTPEGERPYELPRPLDIEEIPHYVDMFRRAAGRAMEAGFDGVQVHGAHGYLIDNFLRDGVNRREDAYGRDIAGRARLLLEVTDAVIGVCGAGRVGVRISPLVDFNDMRDSQPEALVEYVAGALGGRGIAFLEMRHEDHRLPAERALLQRARACFDGVLMANGAFDFDTGTQTVAEGLADAIVYGRPYIANPDLVERFARGAPLNEVNFERLYGGGPDGYTDYPSLPA